MQTCRELGVRLLVVPFDVLNTQNHQMVLEWIWHNEVMPKYAHKHVNVIITEVDVFPASPFSVNSILRHGTCAVGGLRMDAFSAPPSSPAASAAWCANSSAAACAQRQRHLWYLHPGFTFFDMNLLPEPERMCFLGLNLSLASGLLDCRYLLGCNRSFLKI